jgi:hypothetical protein
MKTITLFKNDLMPSPWKKCFFELLIWTTFLKRTYKSWMISNYIFRINLSYRLRKEIFQSYSKLLQELQAVFSENISSLNHGFLKFFRIFDIKNSFF